MTDWSTDSEPSLSSTEPLTRERVETLANRSVRRGLTSGFQALLVATIEAVGSLVEPVHTAGRAALSLGQQDRVSALEQELHEALDALHAGLSTQGQHLMPPVRGPGKAFRDAIRPRRDWVPRLRARAETFVRGADPLPTWAESSAVVEHALGQTATHLDTLVYAQPADSSASLLGAQVAARLRIHLDDLMEHGNQAPRPTPPEASDRLRSPNP